MVRTSPFNPTIEARDNDILKSYTDNIFTEKFKSSYKYKVYITADELHLEDTINYFTPEHIGNIHVINKDFYLKPITNIIPAEDFYLQRYNQQNFNGNMKYENGICQHHKILDCYNLFRHDEEKPEFIIRMRLDIRITKNIFDILELLNHNPVVQICCGWDFMSIGRPDIMKCYCTGLENKYGTYAYDTPVPQNLPIMNDYHDKWRVQWIYAPERQLFEMLFEYCNQNNLSIENSIKSLLTGIHSSPETVIDSYCHYIRTPGKLVYPWSG